MENFRITLNCDDLDLAKLLVRKMQEYESVEVQSVEVFNGTKYVRLEE